MRPQLLPPLLSFLKHRHMPWEADVHPGTILEVAKFRFDECVKVKDGTIDLTECGRMMEELGLGTNHTMNRAQNRMSSIPEDCESCPALEYSYFLGH